MLNKVANEVPRQAELRERLLALGLLSPAAGQKKSRRVSRLR